MSAAWLAALFLVSGFCGLVYETVWLRLAMGAFGVTAPSVSLFLSVFMGGLGLGSWWAGRLSRRLAARPARVALRWYAAAEATTALCAAAAPALFAAGQRLLFGPLSGLRWDSAAYFLAEGALIGAAILPGCLAMGATFPLAMSAIEKRFAADKKSSFSLLYLANVIGAAAGTLAAAYVLIELLGFRGTLHSCAGLSVALAVAAWAMSAHPSMRTPASGDESPVSAKPASLSALPALPLLFVTGLAGMGMEVVWMRMFAPGIGSTIYAFADVLAVYLVASFAGSSLYRLCLRRKALGEELVWTASGALAVLPVCLANPYVPGGWLVSVPAGIGPISAALGFLTPCLVDRWSGGEPAAAGRAYAVNVLGCIVGPLLAGFVLLPRFSEHAALAILALPLFAAGAGASSAFGARPRAFPARRLFAGLAVLSAVMLWSSISLEDWLAERYPDVEVHRDYQADVIAAGRGRDQRLMVNGEEMTKLVEITKLMAHLPMAFSPRPRKALVICFGMGTTFRSLLLWGADVTAVDLIPSVPPLFARYHPDGPELLRSSSARIVVDDGRRFLERSQGAFDVITLDPAPPLTAAGTSLLYSKEFYALAGRHLSEGGVLQQWVAPTVLAAGGLSAMMRALDESFPYVRVFDVAPFGLHVLASFSPIPSYDGRALAARMPPRARQDLLEWVSVPSAAAFLQRVVDREVDVRSLIDPSEPPLTDDWPVNEYFFLHEYFPRLYRRAGTGGSRLEKALAFLP